MLSFSKLNLKLLKEKNGSNLVSVENTLIIIYDDHYEGRIHIRRGGHEFNSRPRYKKARNVSGFFMQLNFDQFFLDKSS